MFCSGREGNGQHLLGVPLFSEGLGKCLLGTGLMWLLYTTLRAFLDWSEVPCILLFSNYSFLPLQLWYGVQSPTLIIHYKCGYLGGHSGHIWYFMIFCKLFNFIVSIGHCPCCLFLFSACLNRGLFQYSALGCGPILLIVTPSEDG